VKEQFFHPAKKLPGTRAAYDAFSQKIPEITLDPVYSKSQPRSWSSSM
jgi:hypothetical protein